MATTLQERQRIHLVLDVSVELNTLLEDLAEKTGTTMSDVLRKAIALMDVAVDARREGKRVFVLDHAPDGISREIIGIYAGHGPTPSHYIHVVRRVLGGIGVAVCLMVP